MKSRRFLATRAIAAQAREARGTSLRNTSLPAEPPSRSELGGEIVQSHHVSEAAHLAFLLVVEAHQQGNGCGLEPLHLEAVRIEGSDLRSTGAVAVGGARPRIGDI